MSAGTVPEADALRARVEQLQVEREDMKAELRDRRRLTDEFVKEADDLERERDVLRVELASVKAERDRASVALGVAFSFIPADRFQHYQSLRRRLLEIERGESA